MIYYSLLADLFPLSEIADLSPPGMKTSQLAGMQRAEEVAGRLHTECHGHQGQGQADTTLTPALCLKRM